LLHLAIKEAFDRVKINFAFPTQTLFVKQDSDWRVTSTERNGEARPPERGSNHEIH